MFLCFWKGGQVLFSHLFYVSLQKKCAVIECCLILVIPGNSSTVFGIIAFVVVFRGTPVCVHASNVLDECVRSVSHRWCYVEICWCIQWARAWACMRADMQCTCWSILGNLTPPQNKPNAIITPSSGDVQLISSKRFAYYSFYINYQCYPRRVGKMFSALGNCFHFGPARDPRKIDNINFDKTAATIKWHVYYRG